MKKTVFHNHLKDSPGTAISQQFSIKPCFIDSRKITPLNTVNILLHIEPLSGPLPIDAGNHNVGVIG